MGNLIYVLYLCIVVPIILMLIILDNRNRLIITFMLIGLSVGLPVAILNRFCRDAFCNGNFFTLSTTFAPIVEELSKGLPVILLFTLAKKQPKEQAVACAFAEGVGFAIFENIVYFYKNAQSVNLMWAFMRGIGAGLMHSLCTTLIAIGVVMLRNNKKLYWSGLFSFVSFAMVYHGIYNSLLQAPSPVLQKIAVFIPIATFIPIAVYVWYKKIMHIRKKNNCTA